MLERFRQSPVPLCSLSQQQQQQQPPQFPMNSIVSLSNASKLLRSAWIPIGSILLGQGPLLSTQSELHGELCLPESHLVGRDAKTLKKINAMTPHEIEHYSNELKKIPTNKLISMLNMPINIEQKKEKPASPLNKSPLEKAMAMMGHIAETEYPQIANFIREQLRDKQKESLVKKIFKKKINSVDKRLHAEAKIRNQLRLRKRYVERLKKKKTELQKRLRWVQTEGIISQEGEALVSKCTSGILYTVKNAKDLLLDQTVRMPAGQPLLVIKPTEKRDQVKVFLATVFHCPDGNTKIAWPNVSVYLPSEKFKIEKGELILDDAEALTPLNDTNASQLLKRINDAQMMKTVLNAGGLSQKELMLKVLGCTGGGDDTRKLLEAFADNPRAVIMAQLGEEALNAEGFFLENFVKKSTQGENFAENLLLMNLMGNGDGPFSKKAKCLMQVYLDGEFSLLLEYAKSRRNPYLGFGSIVGPRISKNVVVAPGATINSMFGIRYPAIIITENEQESKSVLREITNGWRGQVFNKKTPN